MKLETYDEREFYGKTFYPMRFFWKMTHKPEGMDKVIKACRILNTLTDEQVKAVELYMESCQRQTIYDSNDPNFND